MKAALFKEIGRITITEADPPAIKGPAEVMVKVEAVGICGSELHAFNGTHPFRKPPCILGHEVTGRIIEVGADVEDFAPGDRVFVDPQWTCGECDWCRSGRRHQCPSKKMLGTTGWSGGFGEYIVVPARSLYPLPDHVSAVNGTLIEPLSVGVHAVNRAGLKAGESVVVLGTGPIGLMVAAMARVRGASPIIVVDLQPHCLEAAQDRLGASHGILAGQGPVAGQVRDILQDRGADVVFLTVGVASLMNEALSIVEREGRIVLVALFDEPITFDPYRIIERDLTIVGSVMYTAQEIQTALDLISSGRVQAGAMVSHVLPLDEVQRGFEMAATKTDRAIKVVLTF